MTPTDYSRDKNQIKKWRLILGKSADQEKTAELSAKEQGIDKTLGALYDSNRKGDLSGSQPDINKWLGDIRTYFPESTQHLLQKEAVDKLGIEKFLEAPDVLEKIVPDVKLAYTILSLKDAIPNHVKDTARQVIERLATTIYEKIKMPVQLAAKKGIQRYQKRNQRQNQIIDWPRTIRYNLKHYDAKEKRLVPERIFGYNARKRSVRELFILMDQSGSMADSIVYTGIIASVLHRLPSMQTHLAAFDTEVADLTDLLDDPVELLFGVQMGGGTDLVKALTYVRTKMQRPRESVVFVISDLYDYAPDRVMLAKFEALHADGVKLVVIPALSDEGKADFNLPAAAHLDQKGIPTLACTPDRFCQELPALLS